MATPLSIAVCSNRARHLESVARLISCVTDLDEVILVADLELDPADQDVLDRLADAGVRVLANGVNRGLSFSRNRALGSCAHRHLVYVDDDVSLTRETVEAIRVAAGDGAGIVGVWLEPEFGGPVPWWLTGGQYHYLGVHHSRGLARTWGACMAVDSHLARRAGLTFRDELGRRGASLQSGDDTTFLAELRAAGSEERFVSSAVAAHAVPPSRMRPFYLLRRAWWQGRSEVRRSSAHASLGKEWRRSVARGPAAAGRRRHLLAAVYVSAVMAGILTEAIIRLMPGGRR